MAEPGVDHRQHSCHYKVHPVRALGEMTSEMGVGSGVVRKEWKKTEIEKKVNKNEAPWLLPVSSVW